MTATKPRYTLHDGFRMPMGFPEEGFQSGLRYRAQPGDIFIAAYPKCGTTWAQHIAYLILHEGEPLPADRSMNAVMPHLEEVGREAVAALPAPRVIKTHLPFSMTPYHADARYLVVARNPFDCAVSFYHHTRGFVKHYHFADGTFDDFFECFIAGEVDFGDYFEHLLSWWEHADEDNFLFLTYERMKSDPRAAVLTIAPFLGPQPAAAVENPEVMARILDHSSFERMRAGQARWSSARPPEMPQFIRKGVVGDWRNHFSADQARRLARRFEEQTRGTPAAGLWGEILEAARNWS